MIKRAFLRLITDEQWTNPSFCDDRSEYKSTINNYGSIGAIEAVANRAVSRERAGLAHQLLQGPHWTLQLGPHLDVTGPGARSFLCPYWCWPHRASETQAHFSKLADPLGLSPEWAKPWWLRGMEYSTSATIIKFLKTLQLYRPTRKHHLQREPGFLVGAINCTHVATKSPSQDQFVHVNRKHFHLANGVLVNKQFNCPKMNPPDMYWAYALLDISLDSALSLLVAKVSDFSALYYRRHNKPLIISV